MMTKSYTRWDEARKNWGMNINHTLVKHLASQPVIVLSEFSLEEKESFMLLDREFFG